MRKEYIRPKIDVIQMRAELQLLTASVRGDGPVPDALEGDTDSWGEWN